MERLELDEVTIPASLPIQEQVDQIYTEIADRHIHGWERVAIRTDEHGTHITFKRKTYQN